jgi:MFS family permease
MERTIGTFLRNIKEGYRYILHKRGVLVPFVLLFSIQVVSTVVTVSTPQIAKELLKIDINTAGVAIIVPVALGAAIGAFISSKYLSRKIRKKVIIEKSFLALFVVICLLAFIMPAVGNKVLRLGISTFLLGTIGAAFVSIIIPSQTFLQESTPGGLRGRVFGNFGFLVTVATVIPIIFSGAIIELFGVRLLLTILCILALTVYILSRKLGDRFLAG